MVSLTVISIIVIFLITLYCNENLPNPVDHIVIKQ